VADSRDMALTRRAYELWQQAGEPKGRDEEFYHQAEREMNASPDNAITATIPPAPSEAGPPTAASNVAGVARKTEVTRRASALRNSDPCSDRDAPPVGATHRRTAFKR
jgi:hypothetical protein